MKLQNLYKTHIFWKLIPSWSCAYLCFFARWLRIAAHLRFRGGGPDRFCLQPYVYWSCPHGDICLTIYMILRMDGLWQTKTKDKNILKYNISATFKDKWLILLPLDYVWDKLSNGTKLVFFRKHIGKPVDLPTWVTCVTVYYCSIYCVSDCNLDVWWVLPFASW